MPTIDTRVALLEDNHEALERKLDSTAQALHERIKATEEAITAFRADTADIRQDMQTGFTDMKQDNAAGFTQMQSTVNGLTTAAMQSWPASAVEAASAGKEQMKRDAMTKGILFGGIISLIGVIGVLLAAMTNHGAF